MQASRRVVSCGAISTDILHFPARVLVLQADGGDAVHRVQDGHVVAARQLQDRKAKGDISNESARGHYQRVTTEGRSACVKAP
jgi:hypothetical protein